MVAPTRVSPGNGQVRRGLILFVLALALLYAADASRQPTSGSGWRLLAYQRGVGDPANVRIIADQAEFEVAWAKLAIRTPPVHPDFASTVLFWFTYRGTIGCPSRFEGLRIDRGRGLVAGSFSHAFTSGCDDRVVPDSFVVAVDRDRLPVPPYRVQLAEPVPDTATGGTIEVLR
jgi:hypothetical protein